MSNRRHNNIPLMLRATLSLLLLLSFFSGIAQSAGGNANTGKLTGKVLDSVSMHPVEFASVALIDEVSAKTINGSVCDTDGHYEIDKIPFGNYIVKATFVGFSTKSTRVSISKSATTTGNILLSAAAKILSEVVVEGQKAIVEDKIDRIVYNAESDNTTKGGDASDVLKRVPLLAVDIDGNVSLRGSNNVLVLINNKPSTITASSVADALKQIPADLIKNVEVITSPSAKYDAEGSAGIINIILKKNTLEGIFFNTEGSVTNRGTNLTASINLKRRKSAFSFSASQRYNYNIISGFANQQTTRSGSDTTINYQTAHTRGNGQSRQVIAGWDYDFNKHNKLAATARIGYLTQYARQNDLTTTTFRDDVLTGSSLKQVLTSSITKSVDASLAYTKTFEKKDREISFLGIFSRSSPQPNFTTNTYDSATHSSIANTYLNLNSGSTQEVIMQLDLKEPITQNQTLEYGVKSLTRNVSSDYRYFMSQNGEPLTELTGEGLSNSFHYNQRISAAYLSYTFNLNKGWSLRAGGRYEYTSIKAYFANQSNFNVPSYGVIVPAFNVSKKLANGNLLKFSFNKRIQRPGFRDLNPNLMASNPLNATQGNPNLKPEYTYLWEVGYSTTIKSATINFSLFTRNNRNDIQSARIIRSDTIIARSENIGSEDNYGLSIFFTLPVTRTFTINGGTDMFYRFLKNNSGDTLLNASNKGFTKNFRISGTWKMGSGWTMQFFSAFQGKQFNLQGYRTGIINHSVAVTREIFGRKGSIGFGADNFFTPSYNVYSRLHATYLDQNTTNTLHNWFVKIIFSYKIGKLKVTERKTGLGGED